MNSFKTLFRAPLLGLFALLMSPFLKAADLTIEIEGLKNTQGKLQILVFAHEQAYKTYDTSNAYASVSKTIDTGVNAITFHNVPDGHYAISLLHDENKNNQMEVSRTKMPLEGYGTSNARDKYDELPFKRARVNILNGNKTVKIQMFYMGK